MPHLFNRRGATAAIAAVLAAGAAGALRAQPAWPDRPVRLVVPYAPGGAAESYTRLLMPKVAEQLGQPLVVEHKPGANTQIGVEFVARAPADGLTLLVASSGLTILPVTSTSLSIDITRDLVPVTEMVSGPMVIVVSSKATSARTLAELVAAAKAQPGSLTYASSGPTDALVFNLFKSQLGLTTTDVPYKSSNDAMTALLGGQVALAFTTPLAAKPHVDSGALRALGVTSGRRIAMLAETPTVGETVLPGFDQTFWYGFWMPAGTRASTVSKMRDALAVAMQDAEFTGRMARDGMFVVASEPQAFEAKIKSEAARWRTVAAQAGLAPAKR